MLVGSQQLQRCLLHFFWVAFSIVVASHTCPAQQTTDADLYGYEVVAEYPHDPYAFTQGLQFDVICQGSSSQASCTEVFWESTGLNGQSSMRRVDLQTGKVLQQADMDRSWFGEGTTRLGNKLYQIVWLSGQGFIYSVSDLKQIGTFTTPLSDGWGITTDDKLLVLSDGSDKLTWISPSDTTKIVKQISIKDGNQPIGSLNELEMIGDEIWANIWQTECIARICPETGKVKGWVLMHGLGRSLAVRNLASNYMDVLNGIAWDHQRQRLFITGKLWPRVFEIVPLPLDASDVSNQGKRRQCYRGNANAGG